MAIKVLCVILSENNLYSVALPKPVCTRCKHYKIDYFTGWRRQSLSKDKFCGKIKKKSFYCFSFLPFYALFVRFLCLLALHKACINSLSLFNINKKRVLSTQWTKKAVELELKETYKFLSCRL